MPQFWLVGFSAYYKAKRQSMRPVNYSPYIEAPVCIVTGALCS